MKILPNKKPRHAIYILPNAFTTAALFFGFYTILRAFEGDWQGAAIGVLLATVLDACDGRVARLTGTESAFGTEYDSLSDVVAFGVAPAILAYQWALSGMGKFGLGAAFCYCAATALRLARFNVQAGKTDRRFFIGIPSPAAAVILVTFVAAFDLGGFDGDDAGITTVTAIVSVLLAFTMITGVRFYSFKDLNIKRRIPLRYAIISAFCGVILYALAENIMHLLLLVSGGYFISGYGYEIWKLYTRWRRE